MDPNATPCTQRPPNQNGSWLLVPKADARDREEWGLKDRVRSRSRGGAAASQRHSYQGWRLVRLPEYRRDEVGGLKAGRVAGMATGHGLNQKGGWDARIETECGWRQMACQVFETRLKTKKRLVHWGRRQGGWLGTKQVSNMRSEVSAGEWQGLCG